MASVATPRRWHLGTGDIWAVLLGNSALITAMWVRHGGLVNLHGPGGWLTAAGQLTGLYGALAVLVQILLMSRSPWLEQLLGRDRLVWGHRWIGFASVWLLVGHAVLITFGYAAGAKTGVFAEAWDLLTVYPDVLMSAVGLTLFLAVGFTSMRRARAKLAYESWYFLHLYAYLAVALSFAHQLAVGTDFVNDRLARAYWIALYLAVFGSLVAFRIAQPLRLWFRHRPQVSGVVAEAPGVVSLYVGGRGMERLAAHPGQFLNLRFLTRNGWWRSHPYSLSAAPDGRYLRFTVKAPPETSPSPRRPPTNEASTSSIPIPGVHRSGSRASPWSATISPWSTPTPRPRSPWAPTVLRGWPAGQGSASSPSPTPGARSRIRCSTPYGFGWTWPVRLSATHSPRSGTASPSSRTSRPMSWAPRR